MKPKATRTILAGIALAAVLGGTVHTLAAQPAPSVATARDAAREAERVARLEERLAYAHAQLAITTVQTPLWNAFAQAIRDEEAARARTRVARERVRLAQPQPVRASLPERLERHQATLATEGARLERLRRVLNPLYAAFSVQQRASAERVLHGSDDGRIKVQRD